VVGGALIAAAIRRAVMAENMVLYFAAIYSASLRISEVFLGVAHHVVCSEMDVA
jgi:hypothetical protein